jgi:hypothetical protein
MTITRLVLLVLSFASTTALAQAGSYNPVGNYNKAPGGWDQSWSDAYFKCAKKPESKKLFAKMSSGQVKDIGSHGKWCQNSDVYEPKNSGLFVLNLMKRLFKKESSYNPAAINNKSPNPPAVGLGQIGPKDAKQWKCTGPDGKTISSAEDLKNPENNICCALAIASGVSEKGEDKIGDGKKGIFASFWEPARVQNTAGAKGEELAKETNDDCRDLGRAGGVTTQKDLQQANEIFANGTDAVPYMNYSTPFGASFGAK